MKRKIMILAGGLTLAVSSALAYLVLRQPAAAPAPEITVEMTEARIARGRHLFTEVADCQNCHSERDYSRFGGPVVAGRLGAGQRFPASLGLPGNVVAPNLTPDPETGLGRWTDGEKIRAIREGVSRDGHALFPMMPYGSYRQMSDEDVYALVAFLNSLPPVRNELPRTVLNFPVSALIKSAPRPVAGRVPEPDRTNRRAYGEYLVTLGVCADCHTQKMKGERVAGMAFAGGFVFQHPAGTVVSANITPDDVTGIGAWSEERFIQRFHRHQQDVASPPPVTKLSFTLMPWLSLSQLSRDELSAIYTYLQTQRPIRHAVDKHPASAR